MNQTDKNLHDHRAHVLSSSDWEGNRSLERLRRKRKFWNVSILTGDSERESYQKISSLIENHLDELQNQNWKSFPPFQHKCGTRLVQGNLCSASEIDFVRRGRILWGKGWLWSPDEKYWSAPRHTLGFSENNKRFAAVFNFLHMKSFLLSNKHCEPGQILTYFTWKWNPCEILSTSTKNWVFIQLKASFILKWKFYY